MKKVLVVCSNGLGSSFIVEMNAKKILEELGIEAEVSHTDLTASKTCFDLIANKIAISGGKILKTPYSIKVPPFFYCNIKGLYDTTK